jgi:hypothetical protein
MTKEARPPIIIIGMHRSGTSMITRVLEDMGLFIGRGKQSGNNREHPFFVKINEWILDQCGGSWKEPERIHALLDHSDLRGLIVDYLGFYLKTSRSVSFLGWGGFFRYATPAGLDVPWGWKDPRNTYTLPLWMDVFPDARIVHIKRHGVDVANSMKVRTDVGMKRSMEQLPVKARGKYRSHYHRWLEPTLWGFANALQDGSLEFGFELWERYLREAHGHVERLPAQAMEFRYEDFLTDPAPVLERLAAFANLSVGEDVIARIAGTVNKDRAFAYRKHPHLTAFAETMTERLKVWGY